ncbi:acyl-CoA dehydrogenase family protein [Nocardia macrotermitis]|uniref:Flavin-dependent monooxygenase, oxygenase subunit HsaA n=1 Tax=Nocardia macrotermitis TaxID=2585198 RepID=A0A7K0D1K9_9NOCA|nr:acyl-CoA dehydrogenase family protein [Nocardia macrotermitis]MQY19609.1 Flavin-dependent monooxygenase, oxygenase subunit HsaA [Nocardia macrotermitis]
MIDDATVHEAAAVLRAHADKTEQDLRPAAESLDALRRSGILALRTPRERGGNWSDVRTITRYLAELGRACPATAWVAGTCVTAKNLVAASFPEPDAFDPFADPDALFCGSGMPGAQAERVSGGIRLNGRWPNVSGCRDAAWAGVAVMVEGAFSFAVVPLDDLVVEPTWRMAGMRGTGSHTLVAEDVPVPSARVAPMSGFGAADQLLYALTTLGPVVGAARGALDRIEAMFDSPRKPHMTSYTRMGESPGARHWLAEATHLVGRAENTMFSIARAADSPDPTAAADSRFRMDLADAARDARSAVERMLDLHGASGFDTGNELQRFWRDVAVGSRHPHLNPYLAVEGFGSALTAVTT